MTRTPQLFSGLLEQLAQWRRIRTERRRMILWLREQLASTRRRYRELPDAQRRELRRAGRQLVHLRRQAAELTGLPHCCTDCARRLANVAGEAAPELAGGHCCGGPMDRIFTELEVAALWLGGRSPTGHKMVRADSGCLYRGPAGCRLPPSDRPSLCAKYLCSELVELLDRRGALADVLRCNDALELEMARIAALLKLAPAWP